MQYLIAYDFGTTGVKTCLFGAEQDIRLIASAYAGYGLYILPDGGAEQDADEWWDAMCRTTKAVFEKTDVTPAQVTGISFCSQMQGMVLVDEYGRALRRPMSYMDQRGMDAAAPGRVTEMAEAMDAYCMAVCRSMPCARQPTK